MIFYKDEKAVAGLIEKMKANSSIAYTSQLEVWNPSGVDVKRDAEAWARTQIGDSKASILDNDLFYTKSILVSTNWNKNDDVFDRVEVWSARNTPSHKPTNIEHDEHNLVGHITDVWAINDDGGVIPDNSVIDELPNLYHLVNGAVIYTNWQDQALVDRTASLIESIQGGKKFVSMEALFSSFGYALITPDNEFRILARNEETAFLTKHLRAYGGQGEFEGNKLGRLLKNISFSGKGYVDNPANEGSIIFNTSKIFDFSKASSENPFSQESGVLSYAQTNSFKQKGLKMAEETTMNSDVLQKQNEKLEQTVSELRSEVKALQGKDIESLETRITELEAELAEAANNFKDEKKKKEDAEKAKSDLQTELDKVITEKEEAEMKVATAEAAKVHADRIATFVDGGVSKEDAEAKVEMFKELSDEHFVNVSTEIIAAVKVQNQGNQTSAPSKGDTGIPVKGSEDGEGTEEDNSSEDPAEGNADESVINSAEASSDGETPAIEPTNEEEDKSQATRKELSMAIAERFLPRTGASYADNDESADDNE